MLGETGKHRARGRVVSRWLENLGLGREIHLLILYTPSIRIYLAF
jgi:hypothetical protein